MTKEITLVKAGQIIRAAWAAGRKTVIIGDVKFVIRRKDNLVSYTTGASSVKKYERSGKHVKRVESWLIARPANKNRKTPVYNVEMEPGKNSRSAPNR